MLGSYRRFFAFLFIFIGVSSSLISFGADSQPSKLLHVWADFPSSGLSQIPCLPTLNDHLSSDNNLGFVARIKTNDFYGMPGWTRDLGERFHKGVDILPIHFEKSEKTVKIDYYDPKAKKSFSENEPILVPKDEIFAILDGIVIVANTDEQRSGYGRYIMIQHKFANGSPFVSMYAHLNRVDVKEGDEIHRGDHIAWMGNTSSSSGGRMYLQFVPHCHFEVGRIIDTNFVNTKYAKLLYPRIIGGNADPRNMQPYDPLQFLLTYRAEPRPQFVFSKENSSASSSEEETTNVYTSHRSR
jgi:hypothetical protein